MVHNDNFENNLNLVIADTKIEADQLISGEIYQKKTKSNIEIAIWYWQYKINDNSYKLYSSFNYNLL